MTQQVRTSYRRHRRAAWGLAVALAVAVAVVVIPLANAADKTFTVTVAPTTMCTSTTDGGASTDLTLKNTGSPQTMGSAEVYFPPNTVFQASAGTLLKNTTTTTSGGPKDVIRFGTLGLAPGQSKLVTVSFKANANFSTSITAVVKQSNNFNDSSGSANLFTVQGSFPTLRVVQCFTVSGRVFQDRNLDNAYTTGTGAFLNSDVPKAWTVTLYAKDVGALASTYALAAPPTTSGGPNSADPGKYEFTQVPGLRDYKICVTAAGTDASSKWALQNPTGNPECGQISAGGPTSSAANRLSNLSADALNPNCSPTLPATCFQVVPVVGPFGQGDTSTVGGYQVTAGSNQGQKPDDFYVQDTWVDSNGRTNFRFSPINGCTPNCPINTPKIYLLETLTVDVPLNKLAGQQASIKYDDFPPFLDSELKPMPYCNFDPRQAGGGLAQGNPPNPVLPGTDTSCIVTGAQSVLASGNLVHVQYQVYTAYDGGRQIPGTS